MPNSRAKTSSEALCVFVSRLVCRTQQRKGSPAATPVQQHRCSVLKLTSLCRLSWRLSLRATSRTSKPPLQWFCGLFSADMLAQDSCKTHSELRDSKRLFMAGGWRTKEAPVITGFPRITPDVRRTSPDWNSNFNTLRSGTLSVGFSQKNWFRYSH